MNPFMILASILYLSAALYELKKGSPLLAALYFCYSISNVLLIFIDKGIKS